MGKAAKRNVTLAVDRQLLKRARALAARRGSSLSAMLADELEAIVARDSAYERAKRRALALLQNPPRLGGAPLPKREALHDRKGLR